MFKVIWSHNCLIFNIASWKDSLCIETVPRGSPSDVTIRNVLQSHQGMIKEAWPFMSSFGCFVLFFVTQIQYQSHTFSNVRQGQNGLPQCFVSYYCFCWFWKDHCEVKWSNCINGKTHFSADFISRRYFPVTVVVYPYLHYTHKTKWIRSGDIFSQLQQQLTRTWNVTFN